MAAEAKKLPKPFRKPIPEKKFRKRILKRIYIDKERDFLLSLVERDESGRYVMSKTPTKAEAKRLKGLMKSVRRNRGTVTGWKLGILGTIVAAVLIFNLLFLDSLAGNAAERGLEGVFGAQVELEGFDIRILSGSIAFDSLTVADRKSPMKNLFELGESELTVSPGALLKKRLLIDRAVSTGIAVGTPRSESGALTDSGAGSAAEAESGSGGIDGLLQDADPAAILAARRDELRSPGYVEEVNDEYRRLLGEWPSKIDSIGDELDEARRAAGAISSLRPASIDRLDEAAAALKTVEENLPPIRSAAEEVEKRSRELDADRAALRELQSGLTRAIEQDYALLEGMVADPGGELRGIAGEAAENLLTARVGAWYDRILSLVSAAGKLRGGGDTPEARREGRSGRRVDFPLRGEPRFRLRELRIAGSPEQGGIFEFRANEISSNPDLSGRPTTFTLRTDRGGPTLGAEGTLDLRSEAEERLKLAASFGDGTVAFSEGLGSLGIDSLAAGLAGSFELTLLSDESSGGSGRLVLAPLDPVFSGSSDPVADAVADIVGGLDEAGFSILFAAEGDRLTLFEVETELDAILSRRLGEYLRRRGEALAADLQQALRDELAASLAENRRLQGVLDEYGGEVAAAVRDADSFEEAAAAQQRKIEERGEEIAAEAAGDAKKILEDAGSKLKLPF